MVDFGQDTIRELVLQALPSVRPDTAPQDGRTIAVRWIARLDIMALSSLAANR
jgi:hypothetical protein